MVRNLRVKHAQAWEVQGWVISWEEGHWGGEELRELVCSGLGCTGMGDLLRKGALVGEVLRELSVFMLGECRDG